LNKEQVSHWSEHWNELAWSSVFQTFFCQKEQW